MCLPEAAAFFCDCSAVSRGGWIEHPLVLGVHSAFACRVMRDARCPPVAGPFFVFLCVGRGTEGVKKHPSLLHHYDLGPTTESLACPPACLCWRSWVGPASREVL